MKLELYHKYILNLSVVDVLGRTANPTKAIVIEISNKQVSFISEEGFFDPESSTYVHIKFTLFKEEVEKYLEKPMMLEKEKYFPLLKN